MGRVYQRGRRSGRARVSSARSAMPALTARSMPCALCSVSWYSRSGHGVGDDAAADLQEEPVADAHQGADDDVEVEGALGDPAERARVGPAAHRLELVDDLHAAHLGAAGDRAAGEHRPDEVDGVARRVQVAAHVAHDVDHVRVVLVDHELRDAHGAVLADAPEVVALEVDQHDVLGAVLGVEVELLGQRVVLGARGRRAGACRRSAASRPSRRAPSDTRRSGDDEMSS